MLIYLHGFNSSPGSHKTQVLKRYMEERDLGDQYCCPALPHLPMRAIALIEAEIAKHLSQQERATGQKKVIILSHTPPEGILDQAQRFSTDGKPRSIGSRSLSKFLRTHKSVVAVVCGHVHRCGGKHTKVGRAIVLNASNHYDYKAVARFAVLQLHPRGRAGVAWREIRETSIVPGIGEPSAERWRAAIGRMTTTST